jgi:hypothetical protein
MVRSRPVGLLAGLLACAVGAACADEQEAATQLILVADTNIARIESIEFRVESANVPQKSAVAMRTASGEPVYLTLFREDGPLGPLTITARGLRGMSTLVQRTHVVSFAEGQTLIVPLHLAQLCVGRMCAEGQTCGEFSCVPQELDSESLLPWTGRAPGLDDGGQITQCDAQGMVDLMTDPTHCGQCDVVCSTPSSMQHTVPTCVAGKCGASCETLFADCDGRASTGCEQSLTEMNSCGSCTKSCNANQTCSAAGTCVKK